MNRLLLAILSFAVPSVVAAQDSTVLYQGLRGTGASVDRMQLGPNGELHQLMVRFTTVGPDRLGSDAGLGLIAMEGLAGFSGEAGPAIVSGGDNASVLFRGGFNLLMVPGGGGLFGAYAGGAILIGTKGPVVMRLGVARHFYPGGEVDGWTLSLGLMSIKRPR